MIEILTLATMKAYIVQLQLQHIHFDISPFVGDEETEMDRYFKE